MTSEITFIGCGNMAQAMISGLSASKNRYQINIIENDQKILDKVKVQPRLTTKPLRLTVMDYFNRSKGEMIGDVVQAKVEAGIIHEKDQVLLMP